MPNANPVPSIDLDRHVFEENEVLIYVQCPTNRLVFMEVLKKMLGHITLGGDDGERYYSYGFSKEKSTLLDCTLKNPLPNIFNCTAFKKHGYMK